jgi:hypothetical protein
MRRIAVLAAMTKKRAGYGCKTMNKDSAAHIYITSDSSVDYLSEKPVR